jgi:hypothetical protein
LSDIVPAHEQAPAAHLERRTLREIVAYPPHGPRAEDPHYAIFNHAKHHLVHVLGAGCWIGGATLAQVKAGLPEGHRCSGATQLEAHHAVAEFSGLNEIDWQKVAKDFPLAGIHSDEDFLRYAESDLMIICDKHHRFAGTGIHSVTYPAWLLDRYARAEWEFLVPPAAKGTA